MEQKQKKPGERALELIRLLLLELIRLLLPEWQPDRQEVLRWIRIAIAVGILIIGGLLILDVVSSISGIKLWNLLKVLAVPITVGAAVPWLNWLQKKRDLEVENRRAQDEALQAYFDQMSKLLINNRNSAGVEFDNAFKAVARTWTLTVLDTLDSGKGGRHKRRILRFLYEADLIGKKEDGEEDLDAVVDLSRASLVDADLNGANLRGVDLRGADLGHATLSETDLSGAKLEGARKRVEKKKTVPLKPLLDKELAQMGPTLNGATMPEGQEYEGWLGTREGQDWLRTYKKNLGEDKKSAGVYKDWIETTEGKMWLKAVR